MSYCYIRKERLFICLVLLDLYLEQQMTLTFTNTWRKKQLKIHYTCTHWINCGRIFIALFFIPNVQVFKKTFTCTEKSNLDNKQWTRTWTCWNAVVSLPTQSQQWLFKMSVVIFKFNLPNYGCLCTCSRSDSEILTRLIYWKQWKT